MKKFLLVAAVLAASLGVCEILARAVTARRLFYDVEMNRYGLEAKKDASDPDIAHVHRPGYAGRLMGVDVRINSDGLRDREYSVVRDPRAERMIFLGDSLTFGWGVEEKDTFASVLERRLGAARPVEILNFGCGNYNTAQEAALFLKKGLKYRPDRVVVFYFINDAEPTPRKSPVGFLGRSHAVTLYRSLFRGLGRKPFDEYYARLYDEGAPGWEAVQRAFTTLRDACSKHGIRLQVALLPELHRLGPYAFEKEHAKVLEFLSRIGVEATDLAPGFAAGRDERTLWVAPDDAHPNAEAHRLIAARVEEMLA